MLIMERFPFGPSVNMMYKTLPNYRRAPTAEFQKFKRRVKKWAEEHSDALYASPEYKELKQLMDIKHYPIRLQLELTMYVNKSKVLCKDGRIKRFDTSNHIKSIEDAMSGIIGIDDKVFFRIIAEKIPIDGDSYVTAKVSVMGGV
jgi:Holliday junction resolvase RusA-like endonuclease